MIEISQAKSKEIDDIVGIESKHFSLALAAWQRQTVNLSATAEKWSAYQSL